MRRIAIIGNCGSGKTTLAKQLADKLDLVHIELDALFHQADWTPMAHDEFQSKISQSIAHAEYTAGGWTCCGNYGSASARLHHKAADTIVWLDMPRRLLMRRVIWRTLRRAITREELWNGNREPMTNFYKWDPEQNIIRWTWVKFHGYRQQNLASMTDGTWAHKTVYHLCSPADVADFRRQAGA